MQPQELENILAGCMNPSQEIRVQAEAAITDLLKKQESVPLLIAQLEHSANEGVRNLGSILLRKKIVGHWRKLEIPMRTELKASLLRSATKEPVRLVRLAVAHCIAMLAKAEVASGTWPELFQFLEQGSQSSEVAHRELVITLLHACAQTLSKKLTENSQAIARLLQAGLTDQDQGIRLRSLKASSAIILEAEMNTDVVSLLLPSMFQVLQASVQIQDDSVIANTFELIDDILEIPSFQKRQESLLLIANLSLDIARSDDPNVKLRYKDRACYILGKMCYRKRFIHENKLVEPICQVAMKLFSDPNCTVTVLQLNDEVLSPVAIASSLLHDAALALPSSSIGPPMMGWVKSEIMGNPNASALSKKAAILAMGSLSCGCRDLLMDNIEFVIQIAKMCITDPNPMVKEAALVACCLFADYLQPAILDYHQVVLPVGIELLTDQSAQIREKAAYLVDVYAENLQMDALPYAQNLMTKLSIIAATDCQADGMRARCTGIQAISSVAEAIKEEFAPFAAETYKILIPLLRHTSDAMLPLRARATDTIGVVANASGNHTFDQFFEEVMSLVQQGLSLESQEINELTYGFWANMAELYPEKMDNLMPSLIPHLFATVESANEQQEYVPSHPFAELPDAEQDDEFSDDSSLGGVGDKGFVHMDNQLVLAVASAVHCLGIFASVSTMPFKQFFDQACMIALKSTLHCDIHVKKNGLEAITHLILYKHREHGGTLKPVIGTPTNDTLHEETREVTNHGIMALLQVMRTDEDKEVVAQACDSVGELADKLGSVGLHNHIDSLTEELVKFLSNQGICQMTPDDESDDDEMDDDHDQLLIDGVFAMIDKIANAYGPGFRSTFDQIAPLINRYLQGDRPHSDHHMALATLGEACTAMGSAVSDLGDQFIAVCLQFFRSKSQPVVSNACYLTGAAVAACGSAAVPRFPELLTALGNAISKKGQLPQAVDNGVSAVCHMIKVNKDACHLQSVLPTLLQHVPLKTDFAENKNVYTTLATLLQTSPSDVLPHAQAYASSLARGIALSTTDDDLKPAIHNALASLASDPSTKPLMQSMPQDILQIFNNVGISLA
eukprot:TRINITY_DN255_c2_g1_i1.p1 TRINITY_DN255_c2_g1~~TRINITY_DN255_c2_g1_i1.p1  ORF type:complete len:1075 (+),score=243.02 TRINITY_DN255_c2_g1_i1:63-3287(+)